ncbi:phage tail tape measure protein [Thioalkalivibrio sp. ALJ16]|uniref:phage tail tape measure protein n=1 Tax=Thioalkalivibrio sp. ALJ16 TaxID=1158762 RepID=UPI00037AC30B|nr:phage tail tape measure protein [Thioalkalivibrio sp. ALJ16]
MADKRSTVELIFQGIDRTGEATQAALRNAQSFSDSIGNVTAPIADFTKKAVAFEAALLGAGAAITAFSIKAAGDFDSAFREISTLIDQPVEDLGEFRDAILEYSQTSTQPLESITSAIYSAISAGVDYADSVEAVAQAEQLAVAGKADLNDSLTVLVSSLNAYGLEMEEAARFSDALFTAVQEGQTTLPELGNSLSRVTGLAATGGVEFEELLAAISALTATGTPTNEAITRIQQALSNIINPTQQARTMAAELGIEFNATTLRSEGLAGMLDMVAQATGGSEEQMGKLFGSTNGLLAVLDLTGNAAEGFAGSLDSMADNAGATDRAFADMAGSVEQQNQRVANSLRGLAIEIGGPLLEQYGGVTDALTAVFQAVGANVRDGQLGGLVGVVEGILADTESVFRSMAENMGEALEDADLSGFERGIDALREAVQNLFQNQDLSTAEGLASAMTTLADAFAGLSQFTAGVIESFQFLFDLMVRAGSATAELDDSLFRLAGRFGGIATQIDLVLPLLNGLLGLMILNQGKNLVFGANASAAALANLAKWLGPAGLAGAAGWGIGSFLNDNIIDPLVNAVTENENTLGTWIYEVIHGTEEWESATRDMSTAQRDLAKDLGSTNEALEKQGRDYDRIVNEMTEADDIARESKRRLAAEFEAQGLQWDATTGKIGETKTIIDGTEESNRRWVETMEGGVTTFTQVGKVFRGEMEGAKTATQEVAEQSDELKIALEELASNERIKYMEFEAQMNVAEVQAQAQEVEAVFGSINNTMDSTADLLGGLFGQLEGASRWDQLDIRSQIERENRIREEAHERQMRMADAHIDALKERTKAMRRGDSMIKVDGAGLQPHLEAFMWEILRTIQVRVNEDGLDMLLGTS